MPNVLDAFDAIPVDQTAPKKTALETFDDATPLPQRGLPLPVTAQSSPAEPDRSFTDRLGHQAGLTARWLLDGAASVVAPFSDPLAGGINATTGSKMLRAVDTMDALGDRLGLPRPENAMERVVGEGSKMMTGAGLSVAGAQNVVNAGINAAKPLLINPATQVISAAGAGTAGQATKEAGGSPALQFLASLGGGLGTVAAASGVNAVANAAKNGINALGEMLMPGLSKTATLPEATLNAAASKAGYDWAGLPDEIKNGLKSDIANAMNAGANVNGDALRRLIQYRLTGATPTQAGLTLDPGVVTRQMNAAKIGANSSDPALQALSQVQNKNNATLVGNLNDLGAGQLGDQVAQANAMAARLAANNKLTQTGISSAYDAARDQAGRSVPLNGSYFTQNVGNALDQSLLNRSLPDEIKGHLNDIALGKVPFNVDYAEQLKSLMGDIGRSQSSSPATKRALSMVRDVLEQTPAANSTGQTAIDAFNAARGANRSWMNVVDQTPALAAVREGSATPDSFVRQFLTGNGADASLASVANLRNQLAGSQAGMDAARGAIMDYLKKAAVGNAPDEMAKFSASGFRNAMANIGDRKLGLFFSPDEINKLKAVGNVAGYETFQPVGSAVNNSNTAPALIGGLLDKLGNSRLLEKIPYAQPIKSAAQNISASSAAKGLLDPRSALIVNPQAAPKTNYLIPLSGMTGLLSQ